ncbi:MAG: hypothetical protein AB7H92_14065 [Microbacteriaceae bacterium]
MGKRARLEHRAERKGRDARVAAATARVDALVDVLDDAEDDTPERDAAWVALGELRSTVDRVCRAAVDDRLDDRGYGDVFDD